MESNREQLERERILNRREAFVKPEVMDNPSGVEPGTLGYLPESQRFGSDYTTDDKMEREAHAMRKAAFYETKREEVVAREEARWQAMETAKVAEVERVDRLREQANAGRGTQNSVAYNPITLNYGDGLDAERLRKADEAAAYRSAMRTKMLYEKNNTYNPITGEDLRRIEVPPPRDH